MDAQELQRLKELAQAATPGPWMWGGTECASPEHALVICKENIDATAKPGTHFCEVYLDDGRRTALVGNGPTGIANAAYIAAANPAAMLELIALAECAVSPAESIDTPAYKAVYWFDCLSQCAKLLELPDDVPIPSGVIEAVRELAKEKERADRLDSALKEWLDKTQWVQDAVQSNKFSVMYLGHHRADVIRQEFDRLAALQAPDLSKLERYDVTYSGMDDSPDGAWVKLADVKSLLAQPLKQDGGKDDLVRQAVLSQAAYHVKHGYKSASLAAKLESLPQPSDNLQQASTAQAEQHDSDCSIHNVGCPELLGPCDCSLSKQATPEGADLPPAEYDAAMDRHYLPLPNGWEVQTKGNGSTFRIAHVPTTARYIVMDENLHEPLTDLAKDVRAALATTTAAEPVYQAAVPGGSWKDVHKDMLATFESLNYPTRTLYRAAPPQQSNLKGE